jgi:hypothetical protein
VQSNLSGKLIIPKFEIMTILPLRDYVAAMFSLKQQMQTPDLSLTGTRQTSKRTSSLFCKDCKKKYRYAPHNDVPFNDGPHI